MIFSSHFQLSKQYENISILLPSLLPLLPLPSLPLQLSKSLHYFQYIQNILLLYLIVLIRNFKTASLTAESLIREFLWCRMNHSYHSK